MSVSAAKFRWTPELDAIMTEMAPDYSAREIAMKIGVTRNMVIGRCRRGKIDLASPATKIQRGPILRLPINRLLKRAPVWPRSPAPPPPARPTKFVAYGGETDPAIVDAIARQRMARLEQKSLARTEAWQPKPVAYFNIRDGLCRWPLWGKDTPFSEKFFCGLPTEGETYCPHCAARGTAPKTTKWLDSKLGIDKVRAAA